MGPTVLFTLFERESKTYKTKSRPYHLTAAPWVRLLFCLILAGLLATALTLRTVSAHTGDHTVRLSRTPAGPYALSAWTSPSLPRTGEIQVEAIVYGSDGLVLQDCLIYIELSPLDGKGKTQSVLARPVSGVEQMQEAAFRVEEPGRYHVKVAVLDEAGTAGQAGFELEVVEVTVAARALIDVVLAASVLLAAWMLAQGWRIWRRQEVSAAT